ncbi:uncharacterized protein GGS22DRAFT_184557 [Annulohypoxylon maeteangense]|uniref:uncharacterized protein n=1 Tax=Annulohypoxylon maeteangense TaxID=1927788 RepID=UPI0020083AD4|nr:uncharacterized protein GGS22DRAFT_184557 [Annulohypoxylon maeteangense]KAI0888982.1 hypothetical protein GGS22DRAFT_184557 [Annulohypoxylon maeteangense]
MPVLYLSILLIQEVYSNHIDTYILSPIMRLSGLIPILAASTAVASDLANHGPTASSRNIDESLPASDINQPLELRGAQGEPLRPIKKGTAVAKGLCLYSVEELQTGPVIFFSPYTLDQLIVAKERLEREGDCQVFHTSSINALSTRSGGILEADRNAPRCVNAILPSPSPTPGDAEVSPDNSNKSSATTRHVSVFSLAIAFTALIAL